MRKLFFFLLLSNRVLGMEYNKELPELPQVQTLYPECNSLFHHQQDQPYYAALFFSEKKITVPLPEDVSLLRIPSYCNAVTLRLRNAINDQQENPDLLESSFYATLNIYESLLLHPDLNPYDKIINNSFYESTFDYIFYLVKRSEKIKALSLLRNVEERLNIVANDFYKIEFNRLKEALFIEEDYSISSLKQVTFLVEQQKSNFVLHHRCCQQSKSYSGLYKHIKNRHKNNKCNICAISFEEITDLLYHLRDEHKLFHICSCKEIFTSRLSFSKHESLCSNKGTQKVQRRTSKQLITCSCKNQFKNTKKNLHRHLIKFHLIDRTFYQCPYCSSKFNFIDDITDHVWVSHPLKKIVK